MENEIENTGNKKWLIIGIVVAILVMVGGFFYFTGEVIEGRGWGKF